jgi:hypothetical protein
MKGTLMDDPEREDPDEDDNTSGWRPLVRNPYTTTPTERTSPEPDDLAEEQARYAERFFPKREV